MLKRLDGDDNGTVELAEMEQMKHGQRMFDRMDENEDGVISQEEFDAMKGKRGRKAKRQSSDAVPEMPDDGPDMERRLQDRARAQALRAALSDLPDRQKQALVLRHLEGLSNPDVAQIMQISVEAVESLMSRGKRSLADALAPQKKALGLEDDG